MGRLEKSIIISASPEKVWEMLAFDRFPEWMDSMKSVAYNVLGAYFRGQV